jgi:hypothetical protein
MRIMTNRTLLGPGVVGHHDLTLLQRPARHSFMAKRAKLARVGRYDHFEILWVIGAGSRSLEPAEIVTLTTGAVTPRI